MRTFIILPFIPKSELTAALVQWLEFVTLNLRVSSYSKGTAALSGPRELIRFYDVVKIIILNADT